MTSGIFQGSMNTVKVLCAFVSSNIKKGKICFHCKSNYKSFASKRAMWAQYWQNGLQLLEILTCHYFQKPRNGGQDRFALVLYPIHSFDFCCLKFCILFKHFCFNFPSAPGNVKNIWWGQLSPYLLRSTLLNLVSNLNQVDSQMASFSKVLSGFYLTKIYAFFI